MWNSDQHMDDTRKRAFLSDDLGHSASVNGTTCESEDCADTVTSMLVYWEQERC